MIHPTWEAPRTDPPAAVTAQVLTVGMTYRDLIMTGMEALPRLGEESYASALHEMWGGIATMARVCRSLGLSTALCTALGDDKQSRRLVSDMSEAGIDTTLSVTHPGWRLPVTVALSLPGDRAMVTVEDPPPAGIAAHLDDVTLDVAAVVVDLRDPGMDWLTRARSRGAKVFASRGFDPTGNWGEEELGAIGTCDVWMLNELEARAFTGRDDPVAAAAALSARAPLVIVTLGADGMVGIDSTTGEQARVRAFPVTPQSLTGAGDSTLAALVFASQIPGLSLADRLDVTAFIAASVIERPGGAANPPDLSQLVARARERVGDDQRLVRIIEILEGRWQG